MIRRLQIFLFAAVLFFQIFNVCSQSVFPLQEGTVVALTDVEKGKSLISVEDEYTAVLSKFDLQSKTMRKDNPTVADYLTNAASQVLEWNESEKDRLKQAVSFLNGKITSLGLKLKMPDTIFIV